jgi:RHS repeat-associated protein
MSMPSRTTEGGTYRYGFNGKETDQETRIQDYGMRWYLPNICRFPSVDPITKEYPELTPYQFASNRPIQGIDLDGLEFFNTIVKRAAKAGLKKVTKEFVKDHIYDRLKNYASKNWAKQLMNDADAALTLAEDSWAEIIVETVVEQIPYAGPAYSAYDFAKENKKLWDALSFVNNKAEKYVKRVDDVATSFVDKYGKKISIANAELRGALKLTSNDMQAHHVIPCELFKENSEIGDFVKSAVAGGFDFNKSNNGIGLPTSFHLAGHPQYTRQIREKIEKISDRQNMSPERAAQELQVIATDVKQQLDKLKDGTTKINNIKLK